MLRFKTINLYESLYDFLRFDLSINKITGRLSIHFRLLFAIIYEVQKIINIFDEQREYARTVAGCQATIGCIAGCLNKLYDVEQKRIYIVQQGFDFNMTVPIDEDTGEIQTTPIDEENGDTNQSTAIDSPIIGNTFAIFIPTELLSYDEEISLFLHKVILPNINFTLNYI